MGPPATVYDRSAIGTPDGSPDRPQGLEHRRSDARPPHQRRRRRGGTSANGRQLAPGSGAADPIVNPAAACAAGPRRRRRPRHDAGRSCTCRRCDGRWRGPSYVRSWRRPPTPSTRTRENDREVRHYTNPGPSATRGGGGKRGKTPRNARFAPVPARCRGPDRDQAGASSDGSGGRVSTSGPLSVMAIVCSKWALGNPSTVDCVQ